MIFNRPLTDEERRVSRRRISVYNLVNGVSYVCVGQTVMVLAAVRLGCPDAVSAAIGTMLYVGFVMLPLGRIAAARWGAARSAAGAWVLRNAFALLIAAAALWAQGRPLLASALVLTGSFGFFGCRAAAAVLQGPLNGEAALPEERSRMIGLFGALFYVGMTLGLAGVVVLLGRSESAETIALVVGIGSCFGVWSSWFLGRAHESSALREGARKPIRADVRKCLSDRRFRRLIPACCALNLTMMLVHPASVIILKRGYGASDRQTMLLTAAFVVASAAGSWLTGPIGRRYGPRKEIIAADLTLLGVCAFWVALPDASAAAPGFAMAALWAGGFFALGLVRAMMDSAIMHYSIAVAAPELRISASVVLYTMMGVLAGVIGLSVSSALLGRVSAGGATDLPGPRALAAYRAYFRWILVLLAPLSVFMLRIIPLPEEVRMTIRHHHVSH